jgi:hypothetical protein
MPRTMTFKSSLGNVMRRNQPRISNPIYKLAENDGIPCVSAGLTTCDELDGWVQQLHGFRPLPGFAGIVWGGLLADLERIVSM